MRRCCSWSLLFFLFGLSVPGALGQVDRIAISAGTPEDHALQEIANEQDPQKKLTMYQDFVQKFSSNPAAVAYGNWQLSQSYQSTGDLAKALDFGDKALAGSPNNLDILVSQASVAQQAKNSGKMLDYSAKGGEVCRSIRIQKKAEGTSDEEFARKINEEKEASQNSCDFLESCGFNVIQTDSEPKARMADIEKFSAAYTESKYQESISNYALDSLSQLKDNTRLVAYGEKTLTANPNSLPALLLLANYYGDDSKPGSSAKAVTYSQKAIEVAKADAPDADKSRKLSGGVAHNTLGFAYLKQEKTASAVPELKAAAALLKGEDEQQYGRALYGLGFAYGKLNKLSEAREVLTQAVKVQSPWQPMSQELLAKVNGARAKGN
jgi:tetratricopeptide (TPR) repeat protein